MMPRLSILIPSIPTRFEMSVKKYRAILDIVGDRNIEVLMLTDNYKRSIGMKREALKNAANGKYFMFVDDDDNISSDIDALYHNCMYDVDVITFLQSCRNNDGSRFTVTFGLHNDVEHNTQDERYLDCNRPPFHVCAWHNRFKKFQYPDVNYGEDWGWVKKCLKKAQTEIHIPQIIHYYEFDPNVTEASTESNPIWKNPNE